MGLFDNSLLPSYTKAAKKAKAGGYSSLFEKAPDISKIVAPEIPGYLQDGITELSTGILKDPSSALDKIPGVVSPLMPIIKNVVSNPSSVVTGAIPGATNVAQSITPSVNVEDKGNIYQKDSVPYSPEQINVKDKQDLVSPSIPGASNVQDVAADEGLSEQDKMKSVIDSTLMNVLKGGSFPGTDSAISGNRESLAALAQDLRGKAGLNLSKSGGIGQGTQVGTTDNVNNNIMRMLAESERGISALKSEEFKEALGAAQSGSQFDRSLGLQERQLEESGRRVELQALQTMAGDNPVLQSKLINTYMGQQGVEFSPEEKERMKEFYETAKAREQKLSDAELKVLEAVPGIVEKQIADIQKPTTQESTDTRLESAFSESGVNTSAIQPGDWQYVSESPEWQKKLSEAGALETSPTFSQISTVDSDTEKNEQTYLQSNPWAESGRLIMHEGEVWEVVGLDETKEARWPKRDLFRIGVQIQKKGGTERKTINESNAYKKK